MASSSMSVINAVANASAHQAILQMKSRIEQSNNTISDIETQISTTNDKIVSTRNEHGLTAKRINILYKQILNIWKTKHGNSKDVHDKVKFFQNTTKKMLTNSTELHALQTSRALRTRTRQLQQVKCSFSSHQYIRYCGSCSFSKSCSITAWVLRPG